MREICIQVPSFNENETVDVEVTVNGKKQHLNYRVESFDWSTSTAETRNRIEKLRDLITGYDPGWDLVQIGIPDGDVVPVMFRRKMPVN